MATGTAAELHALIHSLSPTEKRYFKLYANFSGQKPGNTYIRLFDRLNNMPEFDPKPFLKWVGTTSFASHLSTTVNLLMRLLLRSLKLYHAEHSPLDKARETYAYARILTEKGRYHLARRFLRRARKQAADLEASTLLLEILDLEKQLLFKSATRKLDDQLEDLQQEQNQQLELLDEKTRLSMLKDRHRSLRNKDNTLRAPERARRLAVLRDTEFADTPLPKGFEAQLYYHALQSQLAVQARDYREAHRAAACYIECWEAHPERRKNQPALYLQYLSDYLNTCILALQKTEAQRTIEQILQIPVRTNDEKIELLKQSLTTQLIYCLNAGEQEAGREVVQRIEQLLLSHGAQIPLSRRLSFYYNITTFHFYTEEYSQALRSLNRILNTANSDLRQGLQAFARIFQILLHYEIGDSDLAEYLLRSTQHFHKRHNQLFELEKEIFRTLRTLIFAAQVSDALAALQKHYETLLELASDPAQKAPAGTWEFVFWVESKLSGASLTATWLARVHARWALSVDDQT